jgi:phage shock protein PspC (stress-responsive transcriptional regulator)
MQRLSVTARLNRSTLQFEEAAYARLASYLEEATRTLAGNPDEAEILADLEQAIADKCHGRMATGPAAVTLAELEPVLQEIGSVQVPGGPQPEPQPEPQQARPAARPLQQVSEGALISGVCQGIARYFGLDVTLVRIIAVLLLFVSGGGAIAVYLALMLLLPFAPREPGNAPIRAIPAKSRQFAGFVRSKFGAATS